MRFLPVLLVAVALSGCVSTQNGDWEARPVHQWKCPTSGYHGFVTAPDDVPIGGVYVQYRRMPTADIEQTTDTDHSGAWELCRTWGEDPTITFDKAGYKTVVTSLREHEGNEISVVLVPA